MISPQEPSNGMSNEEYARVMTGEKYWREHIAKEIEAACDLSSPMSKCYDIGCLDYLCTHEEDAAIARGQK